MPTDLPPACSLRAGDLTRRLREIADLGRDALLDARTTRDRARLRFAARRGIRERVEAIVAAESECCPFLTMGVSDQPDAVVLTVDAPTGAAPVLAQLVAAFRGEPQAAG